MGIKEDLTLWTAKERESRPGKLWSRYIRYNKEVLNRGELDGTFGLSVRCIKT